MAEFMSGLTLERIERITDATVTLVARISSWLLLLLVATIVFDVVTRRFLALASLALQELEWHLHTGIFTLAIGYAYARNSHIRIDLIRDRLSERKKAWIEVIGYVVFLLPYAVVMIYFATDYTYYAWLHGEGSKMPGGLDHRWIIKSLVPIGVVLLIVGGTAVFTRAVMVLTGARRQLDDTSDNVPTESDGS